jgi:thymidylate synthase (FAD)
MEVRVVAHTRIHPEEMQTASGGRWAPEEILAGGPAVYDDASALSEFAGRACYLSWARPNPLTATNDAYLRHILEVEHYSVLEHGSVSFYIGYVSRSLTHELVRHRHLSFSQLSQRYVDMSTVPRPVIPPLYERDWSAEFDPEASETEGIVTAAWDRAVADYERLVAIHLPRLIQAGVEPTRARKMAREAARCVLPNMTPTSIVVTGNHRSWREFLVKRGSIHADAEIRKLARLLFNLLSSLEPFLYQDFVEGPDNTVVLRAANA